MGIKRKSYRDWSRDCLNSVLGHIYDLFCGAIKQYFFSINALFEIQTDLRILRKWAALGPEKTKNNRNSV